MLEIKNRKKSFLTEPPSGDPDKEYFPIVQFDFLIFHSISCEMCIYVQHLSLLYLIHIHIYVWHLSLL